MSNRSVLLSLAAVVLASSFARDGRGADPADPDLARLRAALLPINNAGLVSFFHLRERGEPAHGTLDQLIENLRAAAPDARQQACADLVAIGTPALPRLRALVREGGRPATLARNCANVIEADGGALTSAAARVLAHRRASDACRALLDYLPHAENDRVLEDIVESLRAVAHDDKGAANPVVVNALSDDHSLRRATAIVLLADGDLARHRDAIRKLLVDPAPSARLRAAQVLAPADDPQAVATLITVLGEVGDEQAWLPIEDFLTDLAGALGPKVKIGKDGCTPIQARDAWLRWWRDTEGPGLLNELKKQTRPDVDPGKVHALVQKLGENTFDARESAKKT